MATVLLYADEPILAEGLWRLLENISGIDMVDCCHGLESLRGRLAFHQPDILLADLTEDFTYAVLSSLRGAVCSSRIVLWVRVISTELASQSLSLGIRGILRRTLPADTLVRCLTRVNEGELWFDTTLTDSMMTVPGYSLTRRESQLVAQLSQGLKNKEIAKALNIAAGTVKVYMSRLFKKVGVKDRFELALYGLRNLKSGSSATEALSMGSAVELQSTPLWPARFTNPMNLVGARNPASKLE
jgi:DNA-binding NarL/FixJ family response regulator